MDIMNLGTARGVISGMDMEGMDKKYGEYLSLMRKSAVFYFSFFSLLALYQLYLMFPSFAKWVAGLGINGDIAFYSFIILPVLILIALLLQTKKMREFEKDWLLRSYLIENLIVGAGLISYLVIGLIMLGFSLSSIIPTKNPSEVYMPFIGVSLVPVVGFIFICIALREKFYIAKRFEGLKINAKELLSFFSLHGMDCSVSFSRNLKCGNMKINLYTMKDLQGNDLTRVSINTINRDNAKETKKIIHIIEEYAKSAITH